MLSTASRTHEVNISWGLYSLAPFRISPFGLSDFCFSLPDQIYIEVSQGDVKSYVARRGTVSSALHFCEADCYQGHAFAPVIEIR
jgi:hypothetical protein